VTFDPSGPQPSQIALLTATDGKGHNGGIPNIVEQTAANRREYCAHHGYVYQFVNISGFDLGGAHAVWAKLPAIAETFAKNPAVEWVWWLDLDAIIMTPNRTMQDVVLSEAALRRAYKSDSDFVQYGNWSAIPGARTRAEADWQTMDFLISQDQNGLNAGSFLIRRSAWSKMLLDMWGDPLLREQDWVGKEQDALLHLVKNHAVIRKNIGLIQQRTINGYSEGDGDMGWQVGDIAVHFAGCWVADVCAERWAQFWEIRGRVGSDAF
ncbi:galactosyl transferase, partial [Eremomyces bilateralis CBS 781.70]